MQILLADTQDSTTQRLKSLLLQERCCVYTAENVDEFRKIMYNQQIDAAFVDLDFDTKITSSEGVSLLKEITDIHSVPPIVLAHSRDLETLRRVMNQGAHDFILKENISRAALVSVFNGLPGAAAKKIRKPLIAKKNPTQYIAEYVIGNSSVMRQLLDVIKRVALSNRPVLIYGPTGAGKEIVARLIHHFSNAQDNGFVSVNCGAIPHTLIESQLFGHEKGAFTGAIARHSGYLSAVGTGTLFLDEIAELPMILQPKLLRVLENGCFYPVGSVHEKQFSGRVIAATHAHLTKRIEEGMFREDLYYRLSVFIVNVPPLSEHREDIPELTAHFASKQQRPLTFTNDALNLLMQSDWAGNVRQLRNTIDRIAVLSDDDPVTAETVRLFLPNPEASTDEQLQTIAKMALNCNVPNKLRAVENALIDFALKRSGNNKSAAARLLGIHRKSIERKIQAIETTVSKIDLCYRAGVNAMEKSLYHSAASHFQTALNAINSVSCDEELNAKKLEILVKYSICLRNVNSWTNAQILSLYHEAQQLASQLGHLEKIPAVFFGIWVHYLVQLDLQQAWKFAEEYLQQGLKYNCHSIVSHAYISLANTHYWRGDFDQARDALHKFHALYQFRKEMLIDQGQDSYVFYLMFSSLTSFHCGNFRYARIFLEELLHYHTNIKHAFSSAIALQVGTWVEYLFGNISKSHHYANELIELSVQNNFPFYHGFGMIFKGYAIAYNGQPDTGLAMMHEGYYSKFLNNGGKLFNAPFALLVAQLHCTYKRIEAGIAVAEQAIAIAEKHEELCYYGDLLRVYGELNLLRGDSQKAEEYLWLSIEKAKLMNARAAQVHAAYILAKHFIAHDQKNTALDILKNTLRTFDDYSQYHLLEKVHTIIKQFS